MLAKGRPYANEMNIKTRVPGKQPTFNAANCLMLVHQTFAKESIVCDLTNIANRTKPSLRRF